MLTISLLALIILVAVAQAARQPHVRTLTEPEATRAASRYVPSWRSRTERAARLASDHSSGSVSVTYRGRTAREWAMRFRQRTRQLQRARAIARKRWSPTTAYALRLASSVFGVPLSELRSVAWCESRFFPFAANGRYLGLFQLSWQPFGFSPFDPVASALSAAATVKREGWRQWECKP